MSTRTEEPALSVGAVTAAATALIGLLMAFWPDLLTEDQKVALLSLLAVLAPMVVAAVTRGKVTPNSAVAERVDGTVVVAGEANDLVPEGVVVRELDTDHTMLGDE